MILLLDKQRPHRCGTCGATHSARFYEVDGAVVCSSCVIKHMMIRRPTNRARMASQ